MKFSFLVRVLTFTTLAVGTTAVRGADESTDLASIVIKTVNGKSETLFVAKPADWKPTDHRPAILFFHGGGWVAGPPHQFDEHCKYFASRGMVAFGVDYRLAPIGQKDAPPDVCIQDARSALRYVRGHAAELGIDPNRIASSGGSAGGHLAAFLGMMDGFDDPNDDLKISARSNAMLLFCPAIDNGPTANKAAGYNRVKDKYRDYSPYYNVRAGEPPCAIFVGTKDPYIDLPMIMDFQKQMLAAGNRCDVHTYAGQVHGFFNLRVANGKYYYETMVEADKFLASLGWLTGPPTLDPNHLPPPPPDSAKG
jgi:acetyl esterase/lipase